ncbi:hypothetical protein FRB99_004132 [Tulasnella sp. 403]|nr:hypothetical protein FRB99_004132 [Tulasnella sp. 403]
MSDTTDSTNPPGKLGETQYRTDTSASFSTPLVPALLRTPPSTGSLAEVMVTMSTAMHPRPGELSPPVPDNESQTRNPPSSSGSGENSEGHDSRTSLNTSRARQVYSTVPFPSKPGSSSSSSRLVMSESNISERPDTIASLTKTVPSMSINRGRPFSRGQAGRRSTTSRRTHSDPEEPQAVPQAPLPALPTLTPSTSRDVVPGNGTPKRVSFDSDSLQHGNSVAPSVSPGDTSERRETNGGGLKRISSSLERIKQHFTKASPKSDPLLPLQHDPHNDPRTQYPPPNSRPQSPPRFFELRRNPHFWPTQLRTSDRPWSRPCDPYDFPEGPGQRPHRLFHKTDGTLDACICCGLPSVGAFLNSIPYFHLCLYYGEYTIRQLYRHALLRLPSLYFQRVWRIIFEANVTRAELDQIIQQRQLGVEFPISVQWVPPVVPPGLARFRNEWEEFVDSLVKEWKTFNVVSALLLSAILTIFQIDGSTQPVTRTAALASLVAGLFSIVYGGVYVIRFQGMKSMIRASRWAEAAQQTTQGILWNVWVFLSLPAVFLAYSVIFFCIAILSYVWTAGTVVEPQPIANDVAWIPRTIITILFGIGLVYFAFVITTFRSYSDPWPSPMIDMSVYINQSNHNLASANNTERGRTADLEREARERRTSLRRFGSPDVYNRVPFPNPSVSPPAVHSAPTLGAQNILGLEHPATTVGGFITPSYEKRPGPEPTMPYGPPPTSPNPFRESIPMETIDSSNSIPSNARPIFTEYTPSKADPPAPGPNSSAPAIMSTTSIGGSGSDSTTQRKGSPLKMDVSLPEHREQEESGDSAFAGIF